MNFCISETETIILFKQKPHFLSINKVLANATLPSDFLALKS